MYQCTCKFNCPVKFTGALVVITLLGTYIKHIFVFTGGVEVVSCTAGHSHDYPFGGSKYVEGTKILWQFMKSHAKN